MVTRKRAEQFLALPVIVGDRRLITVFYTNCFACPFHEQEDPEGKEEPRGLLVALLLLYHSNTLTFVA